jgi:DNA-binding transcriptional MerR regulator
VGVAARILGCDPQTLRRLDFLGLYAARRDRRGARVYSEADLDQIREIRASRRAGRPRKYPPREFISAVIDGQRVELTAADVARAQRRGQRLLIKDTLAP